MTNLEYYGVDNLSVNQWEVSDTFTAFSFIYNCKHGESITIKSGLCDNDQLATAKAKWLLEEIDPTNFNELLDIVDKRTFKHCVGRKKQYCFEA